MNRDRRSPFLSVFEPGSPHEHLPYGCASSHAKSLVAWLTRIVGGLGFGTSVPAPAGDCRHQSGNARLGGPDMHFHRVADSGRRSRVVAGFAWLHSWHLRWRSGLVAAGPIRRTLVAGAVLDRFRARENARQMVRRARLDRDLRGALPARNAR